ncbi:cytochrome P450 [Chytriomyces sp. MP71]|nr:cytochrome P450 [Chytriomyces sp. MP71]
MSQQKSRLTVLATVTLAVAIAAWSLSGRGTSKNAPPFARHWRPFVGHLLLLLKGPAVFVPLIFDGVGGDVVELSILSRRIYYIKGTASKVILANSRINKRPLDANALHELRSFEEGVTFNNNIPKWKRNRKLLIDAIGLPRFIRSLAPRVNHQFASLFAPLDQLAKQSTPVSIDRLFNLISMDLMFDIVFSKQNGEALDYLQSLLKPSEPSRHPEFLDLTNNLTDSMLFFLTTPGIVQSLMSKARDMHRHHVASFLEALERLVDSKKSDVAHGDKMDFCQALLSHPDISKEENLKDLHANLRATITAGTETTANTLSFLVYELVTHPEIADAIHDEVVAHAGLHGELNAENIAKLDLLEAAIKETMRMYAPVQALQRLLEEDTVVGGYNLMAGSPVFISLRAIHTSEELWPRADQFNPARFTDLKPDAAQYLPFGAGVRKCPGEALALMEMKLVMAHLLRRYRLRLADETKGPAIKFSFTMRCENLGILFSLRM